MCNISECLCRVHVHVNVLEFFKKNVSCVPQYLSTYMPKISSISATNLDKSPENCSISEIY